MSIVTASLVCKVYIYIDSLCKRHVWIHVLIQYTWGISEKGFFWFSKFVYKLHWRLWNNLLAGEIKSDGVTLILKSILHSRTCNPCFVIIIRVFIRVSSHWTLTHQKIKKSVLVLSVDCASCLIDFGMFECAPEWINHHIVILASQRTIPTPKLALVHQAWGIHRMGSKSR